MPWGQRGPFCGGSNPRSGDKIKINWQVTKRDVQKVKRFVAEHQDDSFVQSRLESLLSYRLLLIQQGI